MIRLAGLPIEIHAGVPLSSEELEYAARLEGNDAPSPETPAFRLEVVGEPPFEAREEDAPPPGEPARLEWVSERLRLAHRGLRAELDPGRRSGVLFRTTTGPSSLELTLKVAVAACLPLEGGICLHAAGIVIGGRAHVFFGPSGAGKSTLSGLSPFPVLSDEMVAIEGPAPFRVRATGFWGTLDRVDAPRGDYPLAGLYELGKGDRFHLEPLEAGAAFRRLLGVALVPPGPALWSSALGVVGLLCRAVPVRRMTWSLTEDPWERLPGANEAKQE